jgi:hypothetical protein
MGEHSEVFVAFDVAKKKHAVAIAEGGRTGEVRFLGDVDNALLSIERTIKRLADRYEKLHVCFHLTANIRASSLAGCMRARLQLRPLQA